ncbi:MAG: ATP-binding cassette domain-containing protein, partial [Clostridia bacterium]|nr:ATP-binding cassette domain-containing protein [Clostridia bacterium]
ISRGTESIRSIGEILTSCEIEDNTGKDKVKTLGGQYEFKDVCFNYDPKSKVLKNLNLSVNKGETIALVGESGSGKTTIINMIIGFWRPDSGQILIDGKDMAEMDLHSYRRHISVVPQNTILFSGTIAENITYGRPDISRERLDAAIKAAKLDSVIASLPDGLDTNVGEHGAKLSGGQRQRIAIARAIIRDPKVIIFDEATSALDTATEREIQAAIDNLTKNRTTFIVAHRLSTIKGADKVAVISGGRCVEFGGYDELVEKKGEFWKLLQAQI